MDIRASAVLKRTIRGFRHRTISRAQGFRHRTNSGVPPQDRYIDLSYHSKPKGSGLDKARRDRPGDAGCAEHADLDNVGICIDVQVADLVGFAGAACVSTPPGTVSLWQTCRHAWPRILGPDHLAASRWAGVTTTPPPSPWLVHIAEPRHA